MSVARHLLSRCGAPLRFTVALALFLMLSPRLASADEVAIKLRAVEGTLRGGSPTVEAIVALEPPERRRSAPTLTFDVARSSLLDVDASTVSVEVDGESRMSSRLSDLGSPVTVQLRDVPAGFHRVRIRAHLEVRGDPCLQRFAREAWIRIRRARLRYERDPAPAASTVAAFLREAEGEEISVEIEGSTEDAFVPWHEADALVRSRGAVPRNDDHGTERAIVGRVSRLRADDAVQSIVEVEDGTLLVRARTSAALANAFFALRERAADDCGSRCSLTHYRATAAPAESSEQGTTMLTLEDVGYPAGFTARGEGDHVLRFGWTRPANVRVARWPQLDVILRGARFGDESHVLLSVGGRPLTTFDLREAEDGEETRLSARVPEELFDEPTWPVEVTLKLRRESAETCEQDDGWIHVAAAELRVPHDRARPTGIARIAASLDEPLVIQGEVRPGDRARLGALLWPLRKTGVALVSGECDARCVRVRATEPTDRFGVVNTQGDPHWVDRQGELARALPALSPTVYGIEERLEIAIPDGVARLPEPEEEWVITDDVGDRAPTPRAEVYPRYATLAGDAAVLDGAGWRATRESSRLYFEEVRDERPAPIRAVPLIGAPREETRSRRVDSLWLATSAAVLFIGALWVARARPRRPA